MTEDNNASVFSENSSFVLYFSVTEKIICNYSLPYKIFRFFNEKRFPHCAPPTQLHWKVNEKLCLTMLNMLTSYSSPALGSHFFFCICTRRSVDHKLDSVHDVQIKTTKTSDDYDRSHF